MQLDRLGHARGFTSRLGQLSPGPQGTRETLDLMVAISNDAKSRLEIRNLALSLTRFLPPKAWRAQVEQLFKYVRDQIRYTKDILGVETLQHPVQTLQLGQGDCDDKAMLLGALLMSIGHPIRFLAIGFKPNQYVHVGLETPVRAPDGTQRWAFLETTKGDVPVGWFPQGVVSRMYANP